MNDTRFGFNLMSNEDLVAKIQMSAETMEAQEVLIFRNEPMLHKFANRLVMQGYSSPAFDEDDMLQVGRLALLEAAKNYDPTLNVKFSTYAWNYVRGRMRNEAANAKPGISVSRQTIANAQAGKTTTATTSAVNGVINMLSLNEKVRGVEKDELIDHVETSEDETSVAIRQFMQNETICTIAESVLSDKEISIIEDLFGLHDGIMKSEFEVAEKYDCTRQNINNYKRAALKKLRFAFDRSDLKFSDFF